MAGRTRIERLPLETIHRPDYVADIRYIGEQEVDTQTGGRTALFRCVDYSPNDADREWVARELGDVPAIFQPTAQEWQKRRDYDEPGMTASSVGDTTGFGVPVESLGRDSDE